MVTWMFEPGHTSAGFRVKHMMLTWVRGLFTNVTGELEFNLQDPTSLSFDAKIDLNRLWTGEAKRDEHLKSSDFFDVSKYPYMTFQAKDSIRIAADSFLVNGELTIRGVSKDVEIPVYWHGKWETPYYTEQGEILKTTRLGFSACFDLNRHDFGVSWNDRLDAGGVVVGDRVYIQLDGEAMLPPT